MVKARAGRNNVSTGALQRQHVGQVNFAVGRFARHQNQLAALFQHHIGAAFDQVIALAGGDGRQRAGGTGADNHRLRRAGATGDRAHPVFPPSDDQLTPVPSRSRK